MSMGQPKYRGGKKVKRKIINGAHGRICAKASVKLVLLDEADAMTKDAQFALRRALQSRCTRFRFAPLDAIHVADRLKHVIAAEGLDVTDSGLAALVRLCNGDIRKALNILQVAFLASVVGPRVAAAYAHTTLIELTKDDQVATSDYNVTDSSEQKDSTPLSDAKVRAASKAGLSTAATKAKLFADHEEREIQRLSANIINNQLKRLEMKLKQFTEVETFLIKECEHVDRVKQRIAAERAALLSTQFGPAGVTRSTSLSASPPAMFYNNAGNKRQQTISDCLPSQM